MRIKDVRHGRTKARSASSCQFFRPSTSSVMKERPKTLSERDPRIKSADLAHSVRSVCFTVPFFADLVVIARSLYPIPSRTRPSKSSAPMVLSLKAWKSRSPPGLPRTERKILFTFSKQKPRGFAAGLFVLLGPPASSVGIAPHVFGALCCYDSYTDS